MAQGKKSGGRLPGTPNKVTVNARTIIASVLDDYFNSVEFERDLRLLSPKDRLAAIDSLASYTLPKLSAAKVDITSDSKITIEDTLRKLASE